MVPRPRIATITIIIAAVFLCSGGTEAARILGVIPLVAQSHYSIGASYFSALTAAGHEVTVVTGTLEKDVPHHRQIHLTGLKETFGEMQFDLFQMRNIPLLVKIFFMYNSFSEKVCSFILQHPNIQELMNSGETFDAVIVETFLIEALYGLAQHFNASLITYSALGGSLWTTDVMGAPAPYSHVPIPFLSYTDRMSFWERFWNTALGSFEKFYYYNVFLRKQKHVYETNFPNAKLSFEQQMNNISMIFLNQHFTVGGPRPYPPNIIEVGGIQIQKAKPLPKDLQQFLDDAPHGVIYFCMGSNLLSKNFPIEKRNAFLKVFSQLKQKILWKFEDETIPDQPANLMVKSWMPQNDVLAHSNVKLFITHGGLLGTTESLYHGKPVVGIPIFGDQEMNIENIVRAGWGLLLDYNNINEGTVLTAINTALENRSMSAVAKHMSKRFRDKPMSPHETVVYWTEYVVRHNGAPHLQSPAVHLNFLQYNLIDVYALMFAILCLIIIVVRQLVRKVRQMFFKPRKTSNKKRD